MDRADRNLGADMLLIHPDEPVARLDVAAQRITFGKYLNAGQTCVAPDHLYVHQSVKDALLAKIKENITSFYGQDPELSPDFGRIITERQFDRLTHLMNSGGKIVHGGTLFPVNAAQLQNIVAKAEGDYAV